MEATTGEQVLQLRALQLSDRWAPAVQRAIRPLAKPVQIARGLATAFARTAPVAGGHRARGGVAAQTVRQCSARRRGDRGPRGSGGYTAMRRQDFRDSRSRDQPREHRAAGHRDGGADLARG